MSNIQDYKKKEVELLKELVKKYRVFGIADLTGMPSAPLQRMRKQLNGVLIRITKKRLLKIALEQAEDEKLRGLKDNLEGIMPCLIFTNDGSFKLAKLLRQGKINAAAKAGQVAPRDLTVEKGTTSFTPGPIIGELGALGIKAGVEGGKVVVKEDSILVSKGQVISAKAADLLSKLGVEPMEIGLSLVATYENGMIYNKEVLDVDEKVYIDEISRIAKEAFLLTIGIGYVVKENISILLNKAYREASILMEKGDLLTLEKIGRNLTEFEGEAESLRKKMVVEIIDEEKPLEVDRHVEEKRRREERLRQLQEEGEKERKRKKVSAEELLKEVEEDDRELVKVEPKKDMRVPSAYELAERKKKEKRVERVPSAHELAERKKQNDKKSK